MRLFDRIWLKNTRRDHQRTLLKRTVHLNDQIPGRCDLLDNFHSKHLLDRVERFLRAAGHRPEIVLAFLLDVALSYDAEQVARTLTRVYRRPFRAATIRQWRRREQGYASIRSTLREAPGLFPHLHGPEGGTFTMRANGAVARLDTTRKKGEQREVRS